MKLNQLFTIATTLCTLFSTSCSATQIKGDRSMTSVNKTQEQIYTFESDANGFNTKNFFYDNGEEVVVFDAQFTPEIARKSLEYLRTKTKNPISYVVVTHPNPDKFNGINVFQDLGAKVVASRATANSLQGVHDYKKYFFVNVAKMFTEETYPQLSRVDVTFDNSYDLRLRNGDVIKLSELSKPGVSSNQAVAFIPSAKALLVGDLMHHKAHAWLEGGIVNGKATPTIQGWIQDLNELLERFGNLNPTVYGGRGEAAVLQVAVKEQIGYLKKADRMVDQYIEKFGQRKSELLTEKAGEHHAALKIEFEKAFPSYTLSYMIQYGIYGLLNSKLQ